MLGGAIAARRYGIALPVLLDCIAPGTALAQALGRFGNYFNQELFGGPTRLPWGLEISLPNRPAGYEQYATFQPTFLYESVWCLVVAGVVLYRVAALLAAAARAGRCSACTWRCTRRGGSSSRGCGSTPRTRLGRCG